MRERPVLSDSVVITANRRLARELGRGYDQEQIRAGKRSWPAPDILPLSGWLERCWRDWVYAASEGARFRLLRETQERVVWEEIIATSGGELIEPQATARMALDAWNLACSWQLSLDAPEWADSEDPQIFQIWARAFEARCRDQGWLSGAQLPGFVADRIVEGSLPSPSKVTLIGFNELTPAENRLIAALRQAGCRVVPCSTPVSADPEHAVRFGALDQSEEIRAAAQWCRDLLDRKSSGEVGPPIGVVVPDLGAYRSRIERVFFETLHSSSVWEPGPDPTRLFNISLAPALAVYPLIQTALQILGLHPSSMRLEEASRLMGSPFVASFDELTRRGVLDKEIRRLREPEVTGAMLRDRATRPGAAFAPAFARHLEEWQTEWNSLPDAQLPSRWVASLAGVLRAIGWPGDRSLSSAEFQTIEAWEQVLYELAGLDAVAGPFDRRTVVSILKRMAASHLFQPETEHAPIQILGLLEASGLEFSHLWIMGMHDGAWPRSGRPNPFLPLRLQREKNLPQSSAARDLEFAELLTRQMIASAPRLVVSYPEKEGDEELRPSPLVGSLRKIESDDVLARATPTRAQELRGSGTIEVLDDFDGPLWMGGVVGGGTAVLRHQAACPFRAFALTRLGAESLETARPGLDARDRGNLVHEILEKIWERLGSYAELHSITAEERHLMVSDAVRSALERLSLVRQALGEPRFRAIEQSRLERLMSEWLAIERERQPFTVLWQEKQRRVEVGGLDLEIRADRLDRLDDGTLVVVDYKTGEHNPSEWDGPRPDEPQLPLYAATAEERVSGVFFGILKTGKTGFRGLAGSDGIVPGLDATRQGRSLGAAIDEWREVLEGIGKSFRHGSARVDPKEPEKTCRHCPLGALCRIHEAAESQAVEAGRPLAGAVVPGDGDRDA